ncbi:MAG: DNA translocase FtsK 4TM domain-containing protein [Myxococcales bacterium]|nr:DNA translocase FtsK 4TM domain-containing protein [Myxococcales bacterium]
MAKNRKIKEASARSGGSHSAHTSHRRREVLGVLGMGIALFLFTSLVSLQAGKLVMGPFGRWCGSAVYGISGMTSYVAVALLAVASLRALMERDPILPAEVVLGSTLGMISLGTLVHLAVGSYRVAGHGPGGILGEHLAEICRAAIGTAGTALLSLVSLVVAVVVATPLRMRDVLGLLQRGAKLLGAAMLAAVFAIGRFLGDVARGILPDRERNARADQDEEDDEEEDEDVLELDDDDRKLVEPTIFERAPATAFAGDTERVDTFASAEDEPKRKRRGRAADATEVDLPAAAAPVMLSAADDKKPRRRLAQGTKGPEAEGVELDDGAAARKAAAPLALAPALAPQPEPRPAGPAPMAVGATAAGPMIVEPKFRHADPATMAAKEKQAEAERQSFIKLGDGEYQLPSIQLLAYDTASQNTIDKNSMLELSARLAQTLENYGVKGEVVAIRPGPVVTMYEFAPAPGTRVNKIVNLTDDLALALEALRVRIVAPIPGKAAVGIEVPNKSREKVFLKEIIADDTFRKGRARLPMALGKDIEGGPAVVDLAKMPHLLVAGTTGSGKSVAVNAMITSLLYHCSPEDVRMIMVDPKMLELSIYEGVPHLLLPVVTDPKKANLALRWAVEEMDKRYDLLAQMGVRDIAGYNDKVAKLAAKHEADKLRRAAEAAERALGEGDAAEDGEAASEPTSEATGRHLVSLPRQKLPYIVVVIDEFADLMMCAPKEVETSVARIAQKARASGIHLILATQRPSVDVITGLIKANFPSRIAFHVTSKIDSRTILDQMGAEALLGAGDMLFSDRGAAPQRLHGCYVDEEEIQRVVAFLKTQGRPVYNLDILKPRDEDGESSGDGGGAPSGKSDDEMYDRAVQIVTTTRNASISWVQRQLRIGYNRAARLVEEMEKQGVVSPPDHTNKREVMTAA